MHSKSLERVPVWWADAETLADCTARGGCDGFLRRWTERPGSGPQLRARRRHSPDLGFPGDLAARRRLLLGRPRPAGDA
ncbi:hypothetical protein PSCLAVI8L_60034 [Pseudoclavibacter sp. 8L]|nr:hypothetical protein PSCLAVI8L_60034 [Pseudoclavibacter sp. 8L]